MACNHSKAYSHSKNIRMRFCMYKHAQLGRRPQINAHSAHGPGRGACGARRCREALLRHNNFSSFFKFRELEHCSAASRLCTVDPQPIRTAKQ